MISSETKKSLLIAYSKFLHRFLAIFSIYRKEKPTDITWTIALAAFMGAFYGVFVLPFWSDTVAFGQAWAGLVDYSRSPWGASMFHAPSLQITLPALLLHAGVGVWPLCLIVSAFLCALSFSTVASVTFIATRNMSLSLVMTLVMCTYVFSDSHSYVILYPTTSSPFGQTGLYLCLLAMAMTAYGFPRLAGILGGLLGGVHAVWCACFALGAFPVILYLYPKWFKSLACSFLIALSCALAVQYFGVRSLPQQPAYSAPYIPPEALAEAYAHESKIQPSESNLETSTPSKHKKRGTFHGHNILFSDADNPLKAASVFFFPSIFFLLIVASSYGFLRYTPAFLERWSSIKTLLLIVGIPVANAGIFKIIEEFDPSLRIFYAIDPHLPGLFIRAIVTRWFNMISLLIPIFAVALLWAFARDKHSWLALAGLITLLWVCQSSWSIIPITQEESFSSVLLLLACAFTALWLETRFFKKKIDRTYFPGPIPSVIFIAFIALALNHLLHKALKNGRYTGSDQLDMILTTAEKDSKAPLITSPGVDVPVIQIRTGRAIILPTQLDVYSPESNKVIHVFCYTDPYLPFHEFYANIKPCFEQRSQKEWAIIRHETSATGIMTPADWKLNLPLTTSGGGLSYYSIPE